MDHLLSMGGCVHLGQTVRSLPVKRLRILHEDQGSKVLRECCGNSVAVCQTKPPVHHF